MDTIPMKPPRIVMITPPGAPVAETAPSFFHTTPIIRTGSGDENSITRPRTERSSRRNVVAAMADAAGERAGDPRQPRLAPASARAASGRDVDEPAEREARQAREDARRREDPIRGRIARDFSLEAAAWTARAYCSHGVTASQG
jgi:hypothetical protein